MSTAHHHAPPPPPAGSHPYYNFVRQLVITRNARLIVCVVCGGICKSVGLFPRATVDNGIPAWMQPVLLQAKPEFLEWQKESRPAVLLNRKGAELVELIDVGFFLGGGYGMEAKKKEKEKDGQRQPALHTVTSDPLMKIPIHKACFEIALRFCKVQERYQIDFRSPLGGNPSNISHLYEIWSKRALASCPYPPRLATPILEANKYFGAPMPSTMQKYMVAIREDKSLARFLAHPLDIPNITDLVVNANLQTMDGKRAKPCNTLGKLYQRCEDLPQELLDQVLGALEPFDDPPLRPTRVLPPSWWRAKLLTGDLIPWLWDLDEAAVARHRIETYYKDDDPDGDRAEGRYVFDEDMWDWELLCRQLAQADVVEEGGLLGGASQELWNRRRIWKLLDVARLGHVVFAKQGTPYF
ncbi:hypothetical protein F5Y14DRAFT_396517 [Nemania sp. NC0429]|nr:hypothetical protein F5Y14DRAFT_396517 [Nemania sp. NC0429]